MPFGTEVCVRLLPWYSYKGADVSQLQVHLLVPVDRHFKRFCTRGKAVAMDTGSSSIPWLDWLY